MTGGRAMKEKLFVADSKRLLAIEEFVRSYFTQAKCSDVIVQETPMGTRITIYTLYPGIIIGSGGETLRSLQEKLEREFNVKNPQINVERIQKPLLDPVVVAQQIASALERGVNHKRVAQYYLRRVMEEGARGCEIIISGKLGSEKARSQRFYDGFIEKSGTREKVLKGFATANTKPGVIGIKVYITLKEPAPYEGIEEYEITQEEKTSTETQEETEKDGTDNKDDSQNSSENEEKKD
jgi:small subunit ribosomal protein S3